MRQRAPVSYKANDMNQAKTPSWLVRPRRRAPRAPMGLRPRAVCIFFLALANEFASPRPGRLAPRRARADRASFRPPARARKPPPRRDAPQAQDERQRAGARARRKRRRRRRTPSLPRSSRRSSRTSRAATTTSLTIPRRSTEAARRARRTARRARPRARARRRQQGQGEIQKAERPGSRKLSAMARAAATANDGLKRGRFETSDDPSSHGSIQKHAGGRPAKRQARAMLHSKVSTRRHPRVAGCRSAEHVPALARGGRGPLAAGGARARRQGARREARERRGPV